MKRFRKMLVSFMALGMIAAGCEELRHPSNPTEVDASGSALDNINVVTCGGSYSYGNPYPCCGNGGNCTWWVWKQAKDIWGVSLPGWGNANTWATYARNAGYTVSSTPAANTIGVSLSGATGLGHVVWVTKVNTNGTVQVSEMNCNWGSGGVKYTTYYTSYFSGGFIYKKSAAPDFYAQYDNQYPIAKNCAGDGITVAKSNIYRSGVYVGYVELRWSNKCGTNWARTTRTDGRRWESMVTEVQRSTPGKNVPYSASGSYIYGDMVYARYSPARACGSVGSSGWYCTAWK